jgi:hypothetical protein
MEPHQERVHEERKQLLERWVALTAFMESPTYAALPVDEQRRLVRQQHVMSIYINILDERIAHFPGHTK